MLWSFHVIFAFLHLHTVLPRLWFAQNQLCSGIDTFMTLESAQSLIRPLKTRAKRSKIKRGKYFPLYNKCFIFSTFLVHRKNWNTRKGSLRKTRKSVLRSVLSQSNVPISEINRSTFFFDAWIAHRVFINEKVRSNQLAVDLHISYVLQIEKITTSNCYIPLTVPYKFVNYNFQFPFSFNSAI